MNLQDSLIYSRYPHLMPSEGELIKVGRKIIHNDILYECIQPDEYHENSFDQGKFNLMDCINDKYNKLIYTRKKGTNPPIYDPDSGTYILQINHGTNTNPNNKVDLNVIIFDFYGNIIKTFNNLPVDWVTGIDVYTLKDKKLKGLYEPYNLQYYSSHLETNPRLNTPEIDSIDNYNNSSKIVIRLFNHNFRNRFYKVIIESGTLYEEYDNLVYDTNLGGILVPTTNQVARNGYGITVNIQAHQ